MLQQFNMPALCHKQTLVVTAVDVWHATESFYPAFVSPVTQGSARYISGAENHYRSRWRCSFPAPRSCKQRYDLKVHLCTAKMAWIVCLCATGMVLQWRRSLVMFMTSGEYYCERSLLSIASLWQSIDAAQINRFVCSRGQPNVLSNHLLFIVC